MTDTATARPAGATTPRDVPAPEGALAWVEGDERYAGQWLMTELDVEVCEESGRTVVPLELDTERGHVVRGVTGAASKADLMEQAALTFTLRERLYDLEDRLRSLGVLPPGSSPWQDSIDAVARGEVSA